MAKIFVLGQFKMAANQTECSKAWIEVCYQSFYGWEVQTMWNSQKNVDVYREAYFSFKKNLNKWTQNRFVTINWVKKTVNGVKTHWLSVKEKVLLAAVIKEGYADSVLGHERTHHH